MERAAETLRQAHDGPAWHGPAWKEILAGVTPATAAKHPSGGGHSIWEIVLHAHTWNVIIRRRLMGEVIVDVPPEEDWPPVQATSPAAWERMDESLLQSGNELADAVARIPDRELGERMPQREHTKWTEILGAIEHVTYHGGQVAVLKRIVG